MGQFSSNNELLNLELGPLKKNQDFIENKKDSTFLTDPKEI